MSALSVNAANLVLGPARLYVAAFGATEPLDSAVTPNGVTTPPSTPWVDVGGTDGGVTLEVNNSYTDLVVDQLIMPVGVAPDRHEDDGHHQDGRDSRWPT